MAGDWEHDAETCPAAWTITMRHDGTVTLKHCESCLADPTQEAIARDILAWVSLGAREDAARALARRRTGRPKRPVAVHADAHLGEAFPAVDAIGGEL